MSDMSILFGSTERAVIALAQRSGGRECAGVTRGPVLRALGRLIDAVDPQHRVRPLANPRLEALRRLACASFATAGAPEERHLETARAAGLSEIEIEGLRRLAAERR